MVFNSVDDVLRFAFKICGVRIEPLNNTAKVCNWLRSKGAGGRCHTEMTQHEYHAEAVMVLKKAEDVLNRYEWAVIRAYYGGFLESIVDLTAYIEKENRGVNLLICDAILANILAGRPRQVDIQDKYDLSNGNFYRQKNKISKTVNKLLNDAICKLEPVFIETGILVSKYALKEAS